MHEGDEIGNYNMQYESYYNNLGRKKKSTNKFFGESNKKNTILNSYIKRLTKELIGVLVLFIFVLSCKVIVTPKTQYVYNYTKGVISRQYDYGALIKKAKNFEFEDIQAITVNFIEKVKSTISSGNEIGNENIKF